MTAHGIIHPCHDCHVMTVHGIINPCYDSSWYYTSMLCLLMVL